MTWRHDIILAVIRQGCTNREAAQAAMIHRQTLWRWLHACPEFAREVEAARRAGEVEREYRAWLRHPFRGRRPPTGKGHCGKPAFRYGRR